jgi:signal transduction histidine kinase
MFYLNFVVLAISVLLAAAVSVFVLFRSMGAKAKLADQILTEMRGGNLKARFPIKRLDEVGQFMQKFNQMADEIEHLVERLRNTELRRTRLLQELAHDLRTPVASLKNFVETLSLRASTLSTEHRDQMLSFSLKEIDYLERLVEDLLFLAQVTEPNFIATFAPVSLAAIADEELDRVAARFQAGERRISVSRRLPDDEVIVQGDPHLLRRMLRNAFENAFAFAKSEVRLTLEVPGQIEIRISDDGPGLTPEALAAYGEKRSTRVVESSGGRLSVGLGSVIMKAVAQTLGGTLSIRNLPGPGAEVHITLPASLHK